MLPWLSNRYMPVNSFIKNQRIVLTNAYQLPHQMSSGFPIVSQGRHFLVSLVFRPHYLVFVSLVLSASQKC
jgi:hypothetical protein